MRQDRAGQKGRAGSLPAAYLRLLLELVAAEGIAPEPVLAGTRLRPAQLERPDTRVSSADAARAVANAVRLSGNPGLGLAYGLNTRPTAHGYLGYAVLSSASLREALEATLRFTHVRQRDVALSLGTVGDSAILEVRELHELGAMRRFFLEGFLIGLARVAGFALGLPIIQGEFWFDWPEPDYFAAWRGRLPPVRFGMPAIQLRFPAGLLTCKPVLADPYAVRAALQHCEREQLLTGERPGDVLARVRAELALGSAGYPALTEVCSRLHTSPRSLKRHLQQCGTSFSALRDEARQRDALYLLQHSTRAIQHIAQLLGYSDPPSFTRAFRRWTGHPPSQTRLP